MEFRPIARATGAFQESLTSEQIQEICRRVFDADALAAVELGLGMYNNTYRVEVKGQPPAGGASRGSGAGAAVPQRAGADTQRVRDRALARVAGGADAPGAGGGLDP
jgi:hypothetical protein